MSNTDDLTGRIAVVTGASRGLGAGLAARFRERGLAVAVCARHQPDCGDDPHCLSQAVDVTDAAAVAAFADAVVARFGRIDLWINNAGLLAPIGPLRDNDPTEFAQHIAVNVLGVFHGSQAFVRHLHDRNAGADADADANAGVLINISSGAARNAYAGWSAYCAGKAAVDRMSESIALEETAIGLRVHAVAPGIIDTDMQQMIRNSTPEQFPRLQKFLDIKASDGFSSPQFIADRMLALAFDPAHRPDTVAVTLPLEKA